MMLISLYYCPRHHSSFSTSQILYLSPILYLPKSGFILISLLYDPGTLWIAHKILVSVS